MNNTEQNTCNVNMTLTGGTFIIIEVEPLVDNKEEAIELTRDLYQNLENVMIQAKNRNITKTQLN